MGDSNRDYREQGLENELAPPKLVIWPLVALGVLLWIVLLVGLVVVVVLLWHPSGERASGQRASAMAALTQRIASDYPDWTIESTYQQEGTGLFGGGDALVVVLKWAGPQDFHVALRVPDDHSGGLATPAPTVFQNRHDAIGFIDEFLAQHPAPGYVVEADSLERGPIESAGPEGKDGYSDYWRLPGSPTPAAPADARHRPFHWRAVTTPDGIVWTALDGSG